MIQAQVMLGKFSPLSSETHHYWDIHKEFWYYDLIVEGSNTFCKNWCQILVEVLFGDYCLA